MSDISSPTSSRIASTVSIPLASASTEMSVPFVRSASRSKGLTFVNLIAIVIRRLRNTSEGSTCQR